MLNSLSNWWNRPPSPAQQQAQQNAQTVLDTVNHAPPPPRANDAEVQFANPFKCASGWLRPVVWGGVALAAGGAFTYTAIVAQTTLLGSANIEVAVLSGATVATTIVTNAGGQALANAGSMLWTMFSIQGVGLTVSQVFRYGFEQAMMALGPASVYNRTCTNETLPLNESLTGLDGNPVFANTTWFGHGNPCQSSSIRWDHVFGSVACGILILDTIVHRPSSTSGMSALAAAVEYDASDTTRVKRTKPCSARLVRYGLPAGTMALFAGTLVAGHAYAGDRLLLRLMSTTVQTAIANRVRDYLTQLIRDCPRSSAETAQKMQSWRSQTSVRIPAEVLAELEHLCGKDTQAYLDCRAELEKRYTRMFWRSRAISNFGYLASGVLSGYVMRNLLSPPTAGIFPADVGELFKTAWAPTTSSALSEGNEDLSACLAQKFYSNVAGLPYNVKMGKPWREVPDTMFNNFLTTSGVGWAPVIRHLFYHPSRIKNGRVQFSTDDRITLNNTIRFFQNLTSGILFTTSGVLGGSKTTEGKILMGLGIVVVAATHWRGVTVTQILMYGREAELLYAHQHRPARPRVLRYGADDSDSDLETGRHTPRGSVTHSGDDEPAASVVKREVKRPGRADIKRQRSVVGLRGQRMISRSFLRDSDRPSRRASDPREYFPRSGSSPAVTPIDGADEDAIVTNANPLTQSSGRQMAPSRTVATTETSSRVSSVQFVSPSGATAPPLQIAPGGTTATAASPLGTPRPYGSPSQLIISETSSDEMNESESSRAEQLSTLPDWLHLSSETSDESVNEPVSKREERQILPPSGKPKLELSSETPSADSSAEKDNTGRSVDSAETRHRTASTASAEKLETSSASKEKQEKVPPDANKPKDE